MLLDMTDLRMCNSIFLLGQGPVLHCEVFR